MQLSRRERRVQDKRYKADGGKDGHIMHTVKMHEPWKDEGCPNFVFPPFLVSPVLRSRLTWRLKRSTTNFMHRARS